MSVVNQQYRFVQYRKLQLLSCAGELGIIVANSGNYQDAEDNYKLESIVTVHDALSPLCITLQPSLFKRAIEEFQTALPKSASLCDLGDINGVKTVVLFDNSVRVKINQQETSYTCSAAILFQCSKEEQGSGFSTLCNTFFVVRSDGSGALVSFEDDQFEASVIRCKDYLVGFTQGTFDFLHYGHLNLLQAASEYCDYLYVGVNADGLVEAYKHKTPYYDELARMEAIKKLDYIDGVFITHTLDKLVTLGSLPYEAIFIGDDWKGSARWATTERDLARLGSSVVYIPYTQGISSTIIRESMK